MQTYERIIFVADICLIIDVFSCAKIFNPLYVPRQLEVLLSGKNGKNIYILCYVHDLKVCGSFNLDHVF